METVSVLGFEGLYIITEDATVIRLKREIDGVEIPAGIVKQNLAGTETRKYIAINLRNHDGDWETFSLHHLMMRSWVSERPEGMFILHADDDQMNNHRDNLSYDYPTRNAVDHIKNNQPKREMVMTVRRLGKSGMSHTEISKEVGISISSVKNIISKRSYSCILDDGSIEPSKTAIRYVA